MRRGRKAVAATALVLVSAGILLYAFRDSILTGIGNFLVVSDPLEKSDAIVILGGHPGIRAPKAASLYRQGWAPRIVVDKELINNQDLEVRQYGIYLPEEHERSYAILKFLGVPEANIDFLADRIESTVEEANGCLKYMRDRGWKRLIVVTCNYHTRRSRTMFRRIFKGSGIQVSVQPGPPEWEFDPNRWWDRRFNSKIVFWEYEKLLFYTFRYW